MSKFARYIGDNIRTLRKIRGLSQEQLALRADINASYMGQVERGEKSPTVDVLGKIAAALDSPLEQLVHLDASQQTSPEDNSYADKIAHQLHGLTVKEQEAVYKFVKQLVQFKELD
ncbi:helix-turn-helix transcriptional regulator [Paenibacillus sp. FSL H8-0537]|uniref:helix-turn-helix domain-containing protein n=1 Tax=Paenibacillus sp. FSL H8-0537 TaxID=2921399 RepID=UPI00310149C3